MFPLEHSAQHSKIRSPHKPTINVPNNDCESLRDDFVRFGQQRAKAKEQIDFLAAEFRTISAHNANSGLSFVSSMADETMCEQETPGWEGGRLVGSTNSGLAQRFAELEVTTSISLTGPSSPRFTSVPASESQVEPAPELGTPSDQEGENGKKPRERWVMDAIVIPYDEWYHGPGSRHHAALSTK
ncbi:hypothetical protein EC991_010024 [Linnemannia zychae]|nr:hypothetical protein EC991_010024 [Linnemannia zychae]